MKHDLKALRDLEKRLAEAAYESRHIDAFIFALFHGEPIEPASSWSILDKFQFAYTDGRKGARALYVHEDDVPSYTASLDAAVALVGRVLPGWGWAVGEPLNNVGHWADLWSDEAKYYSYRERAHYDYCPTPALALCLACVRALIAQGEVAP